MALTRGLRLHQYLDDWLIRSQSQEEAQVNTQAVVDLTQSLGWIINQEKSELKPTQVFSFVGYEYHLHSALVKPTQERCLKLQDLILRLKSKHVLTARCLMSLIGLLASMEKMVPEGRFHMRPFQFHLKEHWRYPQSLDSLLPWTETISAHLDWWQNPTNVMKGADLHPRDHSIQLFTDASNEGWGAHLEQTSTKGLWSDRGKRLHINVLELKVVSLALQRFWDLVQLSTEIPLQLPVSTTLLKQSHNYVFHTNPQHLNLHAWCLGVDSSKNKASLWGWQREFLPLKDHQQGPSTSQCGPYLKNGAEKIRWRNKSQTFSCTCTKI